MSGSDVLCHLKFVFKKVLVWCSAEYKKDILCCCCCFFFRFVRLRASDAEPHLLRPLVLTPCTRASGLLRRAEAVVAWRQELVVLSKHVHVFINDEWAGCPSDVHTDSLQRCIPPCSACAPWDSSLCPPPVTSRTAPEEGSEHCRRLGSDRWDAFGSFHILISFSKSFLFFLFFLQKVT